MYYRPLKSLLELLATRVGRRFGSVSTMDEARLSALWREASLRYVAAVNTYVERGLREGWGKAGPEPRDDRERLAADVLAAVRAANQSGAVDSLREKFPPAWEPFHSDFNDRGCCLAPMMWIGDTRIALRVQSGAGPVVVVEGDRIVEQPDIRNFGRSPDGRFVALAFDSRVEIRQGWDGPVVASLPWPSGLEGLPPGYETQSNFGPIRVEQLIVFPDGQSLLLTCDEGAFVLGSAGATRLLPTVAECRERFDRSLKEHPDQPLTCSYSMVHGAVSPRGDLVLVGHQDSQHLVFDAKLEQVAAIGPILSSYPHFAWFSAAGELAAFNECHFYEGASIGVPVAALHGLHTDPYENHPSVRRLQEGARVYAAVARDDELIVGDAGGYLRAFDLQGNFRWQHFVGSTIAALDLSPDKQKLAVTSYGGMLCVLQLDAAERDPFAIGTASHRELKRWLFWRDEDRVLRW
jgi:hypothetical protein